jgi:glycosyltransferase involved in cell wall biosynthesis
MRAAFHFTGCARVDHAGIWVRGQFGHFIDALASQLAHLDLLLDAKVTGDCQEFEEQTDYCVSAPNVTSVSLGPHNGRLAFARRLKVMSDRLPRLCANWDFILLREPSRRAPFIQRWTPDVPKVLLLGGDYSVSLLTSRRRLAYWRALLFDAQLRRMARSSLVFVNNEVLLARWQQRAQRIALTRTTTVSRAQIVDGETRQFRRAGPYELLYVGRIDPLKGLDTLLDAIAILNRDATRFNLTVVGSGDALYLCSLRQRCRALGLEPDVTFAGYQTTNDIWAFYRRADIFVLPTLAENLARSIWEAMSQGCPVITTPIGAQGVVFRDGEDLLFSQPGNASDLAAKISRLAGDDSLRRALCLRGLLSAQANTAEIRAQEMIGAIKLWLDGTGRCAGH